MKLSALDLVNINCNETIDQTFERTKALAQGLDEMGYQRIWYAEHHNSPLQASSAPEIIASYMAALTKHIHVGTGGTMIMHYAPMKIAEQFKTLAALAPNRVDLGIGRAPGGDQAAMTALAQGKGVDYSDLYEKIEAILALIQDETPAEDYHQSIIASPTHISQMPNPFLLGSSGNSAIQAAELGLGYNFATFFGITSNKEIFDSYKQRFKPSPFFKEPYIISAYQVVTADSQEELDYISKPLELARVEQSYGRFSIVKSPEDVKDYVFSETEKKVLQNAFDERLLVKGTPEQAAEILSQEQNHFGFDELMVYSPIYHTTDRLNSYRLLKDIL